MPSARRSSSPTSSRSPNYPSSSSTTTSHHSPPMSDEEDAVPPAPSGAPVSPPPHASNELLALQPPPSATRTSTFPIREDCWSEDATHTLIEAWGSHYLELNRGSLRQQHWQEVSEAVNAHHAHTKKLHRTDIQCKNRIDTLKKKYKVEKYKSFQSNGRHVSTWPFFNSLDTLIGENFVKAKPLSSSPPATRRNSVKNAVPPPVPLQVKREFPVLPPPPSAVPVGPRSKRPAPVGHGEEGLSRRNFSAMAAAAAAAQVEEYEEEDSDMSSPGAGTVGMRRKKKTTVSSNMAAEGYMKLAEAIGGFAEIYERVEEAKQRQMVELEKQRMQFAKDLEIQRMKLFMESQVQLEKLKKSKRNSQSGEIFKCVSFLSSFISVIVNAV